MKSELRKQQYTVTLFDCNHLAHVIVSWQIQKYICYCTAIVSQYFAFEGNFQVKAQGAYIRLRSEFGVLYLEGLIFGILQYMQWILLTICFGTLSEAVSAASITAVYSDGNCSCVHKLVLHL